MLVKWLRAEGLLSWGSALVISTILLWVVSLVMMVVSSLYGGSDVWFYLFAFLTILFMAG